MNGRNHSRNIALQSLHEQQDSCRRIKQIDVLGLGSLEQHHKMEDMFKWDNPRWPMFQVILTQLIFILDVQDAISNVARKPFVPLCLQDPEFEDEDVELLVQLGLQAQRQNLEAGLGADSLVYLPTLAPEALGNDFVALFGETRAPAMILTDLIRDSKIFEEEKQEHAFREQVQKHYWKAAFHVETTLLPEAYEVFEPLADLELWVRNDL
ncbi:MAG: hypothetical protein Q9162_006172 [Coniocarpon cinnabarinum]